MSQAAPVLTLTVIAGGALIAERFVTGAGAYPTAAGNALGVARAQADAAGEAVPVDVLGTAIVEAGGTIAADTLIEVGANGVAVPLDAGVPVARAITGGASGDRIEVLLIPN